MSTDKKTFKRLMIFSVITFIIVFIILPITVGYFCGNLVGGLKASGYLIAIGLIFTLVDIGIHKLIEREDSDSIIKGIIYGIVICVIVAIIYEQFLK